MVRLEQFINDISNSKNLMLDTNTIIYFLDGIQPFNHLLITLFELIEQGRLQATLSVISEAELLVKPYREKNTAALKAVELFLGEFPNLKVIPVTREISRQAAIIRAESDIRLPDSIILATAINNKCDLLVGNDLKLMQKAVSYLPTVVLNKYIISE